MCDVLLQEVESGLQDSSWLAVCKALAALQQLTAHHHDALSGQLCATTLRNCLVLLRVQLLF